MLSARTSALRPSELPETTSASSPPATRGRVLIVEDDRPLLEVYADILVNAGFVVSVAYDSAGALRALQADPYDVVLSDVVMPGGNGVDLLRAIRQRDLDMPVVLLTGSPTVETAVQALEMGVLHYLVKPVSSAELVHCIGHAAELRKLAAVKREALRTFERPNRPTGDRSRLEAEFARALGSLFMAYQPIVRTRDGSVFGWEALLRTHEPAVEGPLAFLEMAERLGRIRDLGRAIRASVCRTAKRTRGVTFFINLHHDDLLDEALFDPRSPLSVLAPGIVLEISERSPVESVPDVLGRVRKLRDLGFRLAVDDLGAGYAGLTSFASLEPDFVKLDRGLITGIDHEPVKQKLVGAIVRVSREMGVVAVAEGIETSAERVAATDLGCDLMQGFLFRRPEELRGSESFALATGPCSGKSPEPPALCR
ncbi:MAG TPA: EAL domain-containing protein [Vicinamibacteria bacterium]|nr:EAL domain-containing protein [Vicinamibacteria bacterium]